MSLQALKHRLKDIHDLNQVSALLGWDQRVKMPRQGVTARAEQSAIVTRLSHEMLISAETGRLLEAAEREVASYDYDSDDAALVRVARHDYDRATKVPTALIVEFEKTTSIANEIWVEARANNDFSHFQPSVEKIFDLVGEMASYLGYKDDPYDALLDQYEQGMTTSEVRRLFDELRTGLVPLAKAISEHQDRADESIVRQAYDIQKQRQFSESIIPKFGFNFQAGRQDESVHPFCVGMSNGDVRITTRFDPNWLSPALFGTFHETGHALYEQGFTDELDRNILGGGTSLGVHESQSRMWENIVGRSRGFWKHYYPQLQALFPEALAKVDMESFYRAINASKPSLIRVEADEVTYNLHIMIRFDLEWAVMHNKLAIKDLPEAWNAKYQEYLGVTPPNNALGVLQDIHWSMGIMGYFPTYTLGNLLSAQFFNLAVQDHPNIPGDFERGEFGDLYAWMKDKIYRHGRKYTSPELVKRITGGVIETGPFLDYLNRKYSDIYGL